MKWIPLAVGYLICFVFIVGTFGWYKALIFGIPGLFLALVAVSLLIGACEWLVDKGDQSAGRWVQARLDEKEKG